MTNLKIAQRILQNALLALIVRVMKILKSCPVSKKSNNIRYYTLLIYFCYFSKGAINSKRHGTLSCQCIIHYIGIIYCFFAPTVSLIAVVMLYFVDFIRGMSDRKIQYIT